MGQLTFRPEPENVLVEREVIVSVEGGMSGRQQRLVCPNCGKGFFAWRPDTNPGAKVKCYFCKHEFEDEAAKRPKPEPAPAPATPAASSES
jgi:hypothetical protein